jgi:predicted acetyltransferase
MNYRKATNSDIAWLAEANQQLLQDEGHRNRMMPLPELEDRMRGWLKAEYEAVIFEHEGRPVAYALYRPDGDGIYLRQFFVDRKYRRRGFGRQAIKLLISKIWPREKRVTVDVLTNNQIGYAFWKSSGFKDYAITLEMMPEEKDSLSTLE